MQSTFDLSRAKRWWSCDQETLWIRVSLSLCIAITFIIREAVLTSLVNLSDIGATFRARGADSSRDNEYEYARRLLAEAIRDACVNVGVFKRFSLIYRYLTWKRGIGWIFLQFVSITVLRMVVDIRLPQSSRMVYRRKSSSVSWRPVNAIFARALRKR